MTDNNTTIKVPQEWVDLENDLEELYRKAGECWELDYDSTER